MKIQPANVGNIEWAAFLIAEIKRERFAFLNHNFEDEYQRRKEETLAIEFWTAESLRRRRHAA